MKDLTIIYIRVSTEEQQTDRQEVALKEWCKKIGCLNTKTIIEKVSGAKPTKERRFNEVLENPHVSRVIVQDIDRLGRDTIDILQTIQLLTEKGINLTVTNIGMDTILPNGKENETFKIILSVMATLAEIERKKIKERQKEGISIAKKKGKYKGRRVGAVETKQRFLEKHKSIIKELKKGMSIRNIAKLCDVSTATVQKVKKVITK